MECGIITKSVVKLPPEIEYMFIAEITFPAEISMINTATIYTRKSNAFYLWYRGPLCVR
jgi:hypothetical protein